MVDAHFLDCLVFSASILAAKLRQKVSFSNIQLYSIIVQKLRLTMFLVGLLFGFNFSNSYGARVRNYSVKALATCTHCQYNWFYLQTKTTFEGSYVNRFTFMHLYLYSFLPFNWLVLAGPFYEGLDASNFSNAAFSKKLVFRCSRIENF